MKGIIAVLNQLERAGVRLSLSPTGQLLSNSKKEALTAENVSLIKQHKDDIVSALAAKARFYQPIEPLQQTRGPLTSAQSGLWFIDQFEAQGTMYNMPVHFRLQGELDEVALEAAFVTLFKTHPTLRTAFRRDEFGFGEQVILPFEEVGFNLQRVDLRALDSQAQHQQLQALLVEDIRAPFELTAGQLTRIKLLRLADQDYVLMFTQHHIISDGWSVKNLFSSIKACFIAHQKGQVATLPAPAINFIDYATWERSANFLDYHQCFKAFWLDRLAGMPELHTLPTDKPRPAVLSSKGEVFYSYIDNQTWQQFKQLCLSQGATVFMGVHALFALIFARFSIEPDIVIGTPVAYRERPDVDDLIGFVVNTLILRTSLDDSHSFLAYLKYIRDQDLAAFDHQIYRFEQLIDDLGLERSAAANPIFQIMIVYQALVDFNDLIPGVCAKDQLLTELPAKTDISIKLAETQNSVRIEWLYSTDVFVGDTFKVMASCLNTLLHSALQAPHTEVRALPLLNSELQQRVLASTSGGEPQSVQLAATAWLQHAKKAGAAPALTEGATTLSYGQLMQAVAVVVAQLERYSLAPEAVVGLHFNSKIVHTVALLACWQVGAAYTPLEPSNPAKRLAHMSEQADISLVLCDSSSLPWFNGNIETLTLTSLLACQAQPLQLAELSEQQLAYVIFTSGSTGMPKGVMIEQRSLANLLAQNKRFLALSPTSIMYNPMSLAFDAGNMALLTTLYAGGQVVFGDANSAILDALAHYQASHTYLPTALLSALEPRDLPHLRCIGFGGEACPNQLAARWGDAVMLINEYGPTECTVTALRKRLSADTPATLGHVLEGLEAFVVDSLGNLCPPGVAGELVLAGIGLARGYIGQPQLTEERFVLGFVRQKPDTRVYRTGDLVRLRHDGEMEYLGRQDNQLKLRGFRIESAEVEHHLAALATSYRDIKVTIDTRGSAPQLVAYVTLKTGYPEPEASWVLNRLAELVPSYMVPAAIVVLATMPLTVNGKVDFAQLPQVQVKQTQHTPPDNAAEAEILAVWQSLLAGEFGVEDDFFRLGGDSILSIQLTTALRKAGYGCDVKDLFEHKTVRGLALAMQRAQAQKQIYAEQGQLAGAFALLPIQHWFKGQQYAQPQYFNQACLIPTPIMDKTALSALLQQLATHHDALRLYCDGEQQVYGELIIPKIAELDYLLLGEAGLHKALSDLQSQFDLAQAPLWCAALIRNHPDAPQLLFIACHHWLVDAVSWRILCEDLATCYAGGTLADKTSSYRQWGQALQTYVAENTNQLEYWHTQTQLLPDYPKATELQPEASLSLSEAHTTALQTTANAYGAEVLDILLAALTRTLSDCQLGEQHCVMLEGHGREAIDEQLDVSRTVGWFTTAYPVRTENHSNLADVIITAKERRRAVPDNGIGYYAFKYLHSAGTHLPLAPITLNYLGQARSSSQTTGMWAPLNIRPGQTISSANLHPELVSLHGGIMQGELQLRQVGQFAPLSNAVFMRRLQENLEAFAEHGQVQWQQGVVLTPSDFKPLTLSRHALTALQQQYQFEHLLPMSGLQRSMLAHHMQNPQDDAYFMLSHLVYDQAIDVHAFKQAWQLQTQRFPALRSCFNWQFEPLEMILQQVSVPIEVLELNAEENVTGQIDATLKQLHTQKLSLSSGPLYRLVLCKEHETRYHLLQLYHHSIFDGWSMPILMQSVHGAYLALKTAQAPDMTKDTAYVAYRRWSVQKQAADARFWQAKMATLTAQDIAIETTWFGRDLRERTDEKRQNATIERALSVSEHLKLQQQCAKYGVTPSIAGQFAWHRLLQQAQQSDFTSVGNVLVGRDGAVDGLTQSIGLYNNTLPVILDWCGVSRVTDALQTLQQQLATVNQHGSYPLEKLSVAGKRPFQSVFLYENYPTPKPITTKAPHELMPRPVAQAYEPIELPMTLFMTEYKSTTWIGFYLDATRFALAELEQLADKWLAALRELITQDWDAALTVTRLAPVPRDNIACSAPPSTDWSKLLAALAQGPLTVTDKANWVGLEPVWQGLDSIERIWLVTRLAQCSAYSVADLLKCESLSQLLQLLSQD
ncbi:amino acid adenylation domain-containing protein [Pseudoalteromonas fenneropenaei]|uniref:Amino acid adenylation domain-containing protein n=1 Tax=Pseudoalteromonas fenneropenaei TaxID=1737459 RepID=A0ABV7CPR6_9GAMM